MARMLGAPVVDTTGIPGEFSFKLEWTPESTSSTSNAGAPPAEAPIGPSLFTVLQQDLGVRLDRLAGFAAVGPPYAVDRSPFLLEVAKWAVSLGFVPGRCG